MKNIIFLDIDGVLNCELFYRSQQYLDYKKDLELEKKGEKITINYENGQICRERIHWLNTLCEETETVVVISSSWRLGRTLEELQKLFKVVGATFKIIGKTDRTGYERGTEIAKWLRDNVVVESEWECNYYDFYRYAIIDDDSDMLLNQQMHFFQTDTYSGLTPNTCYKIKRFFTHKTF
jgi:hypothetical protein